MTLGERIYSMRSERNLSQIDLAEALDVSRQSVSKWETDASVPELDKLVKLCELFEISMDELVRGIRSEQETILRYGADEMQPSSPRKKSTASIVTGIVLLCLAGLTFVPILSMIHSGVGTVCFPAWAGVIAAGIVCLAARQKIVLWSLWWAALVFSMVQKIYNICLLLTMIHLVPARTLIVNFVILGVSVFLTVLTAVLLKQKK